MNSSAQWLSWLYGTEPLGLIWIGGHGDGWRGRTFTDIKSAAQYARELDEAAHGGVYHRLTTVQAVDRGRGAAADSAYLPGFAMDLDLRGPGHKALNYPETEEDLRDLLLKAGIPEPTVWVHSGGGRYPYWKLEQPADLTLPGALERAATLSSRLHRHVMAWARELGWKVDNTSDLARVYRLPGTLNRKPEMPAPVMCTASGISGELVTLEIMESAIREAPAPPEMDAPSPSPLASPGQGAGESQLFGGDLRPDHSFTLDQALVFVRRPLEELRTAMDGEINTKLLAAAMTLAHFGPEFWDREAAERQLYQALDATVYDGMTWKAHDTIERAYRDMAARSEPEYWSATLLRATLDNPAPALAASNDEVEALLGEMVTPDQLRGRPPKPYLVKGVFNLDSEAWVIGAPGSRKSFVVLDLAAHVAGGMRWQGRRTAQGPVVIIAAEGAGGLGVRVDAWEKEYGPMSGNVHVLPRPVQSANAGAWTVLVKACERLKPVLVVLDTQARVTVGLQENDAKDMGIFVDAMGAVRRATGACVLAVHHTGRQGGDARGSSAIDGAQDTELKVVALAEPLRGELRVEKQKDIAQSDPIPLLFRLHIVGVDEDGDPVSSLVLAGADAWLAAEARPGAEDPARSVLISEPAEWTWLHVKTDTSQSLVQRQLLQTLADLAGQDSGLTEAALRKSLEERWYPNGEQGRKKTGLTQQTWNRTFKAVEALEFVRPGDVEPERIMLRMPGPRFKIHPDILVTSR